MKRILLILLPPMITSCEETINLNFKEGATQLVIDAQVLNIRRDNYVKISTSAPFSSTGATPRISDATVTLNDGVRPAVSFVHNPRNHPDSAGFYLPPSSFIGRVNTSYTLEVAHQGKTYTALDFMPAATALTNLTPVLDEETEAGEPRVASRTHNILISFSAPDNEAFFLFKFFRNGAPAQTRPGDVFLLNRRDIGEDADDVSFRVLYAPSETANVQMFRITRAVFDYYTDIVNNNSADGLFSPPPLNPRTNWSNGAIGVFRAASRSERSVLVR
jgi:hypothetical protein